MRTASSVAISSLKMRRDSMSGILNPEEERKRERNRKIYELKGIEKLNYLVEGLNADIETASWKDLKGEILVTTEKNDPRSIKALKERTRHRERQMRRFKRTPSMLHHKEEEELHDESWLKETINAFERQLMNKDHKKTLHETKNQRIVRASKRNRKTLLKFKRLASAETHMASDKFNTLGGGGFTYDEGKSDDTTVERRLRKTISGKSPKIPSRSRGSRSRGSSPTQDIIMHEHH